MNIGTKMNLDDLKGLFKYIFRSSKESVSKTIHTNYLKEINRPNNVITLTNLILVIFLIYSSSTYFQETGKYGIYPFQSFVVLALLVFVSIWKVYIDGNWKHELRREFMEELRNK